MAQRLDVYRGGDGAKASGKGPKGFKSQKQKKGNMVQVEGSSSRGDCPSGPSGEEKPIKKGRGWLGVWWKEN